MAENSSTNSGERAPALSDLVTQTMWADDDDVAAFCYKYIYENILDFVKAHRKYHSEVSVKYGTDQATIDKKHADVIAASIYDAGNQFGAVVREKMAEFILERGLKEKEINWPVQWIRIDTISLKSIQNGAEQYIDEYYRNDFYINLLDEKYKNPDRPTPLEEKVSEKQSLISRLTPEKKHPIRRAFGWILTFLFGLNTVAAVLARFLGTDFQGWLQDVCYKGLVKMHLRTAADIIDSCIENLVLSGKFILLFGRGSVGSWITFGVTAVLFLIFLLCMIRSGKKHRKAEAERVSQISRLNGEIETIHASPEYRAETEQRRAVRGYYPLMMQAFYKAREKDYRMGVVHTVE